MAATLRSLTRTASLAAVPSATGDGPSLFERTASLAGFGGPKETFLCQICLSRYALTDPATFTLTACGHRFCRDCAAGWVASKITEGVVYPRCCFDKAQEEPAIGLASPSRAGGLGTPSRRIPASVGFAAAAATPHVPPANVGKAPISVVVVSSDEETETKKGTEESGKSKETGDEAAAMMVARTNLSLSPPSSPGVVRVNVDGNGGSAAPATTAPAPAPAASRFGGLLNTEALSLAASAVRGSDEAGSSSSRAADKTCKASIVEKDILALLEGDTANLDKYRRFKASADNPDSRECPYPGCGQIDVGKATEPEMTCSKCQRPYCFAHSTAHLGKSCEAYLLATEKERRLNEGLLSKETKPCPSCKAATFKSSGCNHLVCPRCHVNWCWLCGVEFPESGPLPNHYAAWNLASGCAGQQFGEKRSGVRAVCTFLGNLLQLLIFGPPALVISLLSLVICPCMTIPFLRSAGREAGYCNAFGVLTMLWMQLLILLIVFLIGFPLTVVFACLCGCCVLFCCPYRDDEQPGTPGRGRLPAGGPARPTSPTSPNRRPAAPNRTGSRRPDGSPLPSSSSGVEDAALAAAIAASLADQQRPGNDGAGGGSSSGDNSSTSDGHQHHHSGGDCGGDVGSSSAGDSGGGGGGDSGGGSCD